MTDLAHPGASSADGSGWTRSQRGQSLRWTGWTAAAFPVAVLSHEIAHYAAYVAFGLREPALHYGSASNAVSDSFWKQVREGDMVTAAQISPPWQQGTSSAAGLLATYLTLLACMLAVRRRPHPFLVGLGLIAPLRSLGSVAIIVSMVFGRRGNSGSDETHVALTLAVPELALHALGAAVLVVSWAVLLRIPQREARRGRTATLAGVFIGGLLYIGVLGPWLLP